MLEEFLSNVDIGTFIFLGIACFIAAFIDAVAGGGGLITVPAYLASGIPPHIALGTNKVSSSIGTVASALKFATSGKVNWELSKNNAIFFSWSFIGSEDSSINRFEISLPYSDSIITFSFNLYFG